MKFGIAITSSPGFEKSDMIIKLSDELEKYFINKEFGNSVKAYTIGLHCVDVPKGFEKFSKLPKPNYTKGKKVINPDGIPFTLEDNLEYSIKLDFETFKNGTNEECRKLLAKEILQSLKVLDTMKSKINDFNTEKFKEDLESCFKEKELI
jgi:hypothetical protein